MERHVTMEEISDGKLYDLNDMVRADCRDCEACSACCRGMGQSIVLDPLDIHRISTELGTGLEAMLEHCVELNMVQGLILPNLKMHSKTECCTFLNQEGRCSIHFARPGICRLFPLGRFYEERGFRYFLQVHECKHTNRGKIKVRKWIDTPDLKTNQRFIFDWHFFLKELQQILKTSENEGRRREISLLILQEFYIRQYDLGQEFYEEFYRRLDQIKQVVF